MPFVEIWVDEPSCDGMCASSMEAENLQARIDEAAALLRQGHFDAALHALTEDSAICVKSPKRIADQYERWRNGRLPGFANFGKEVPA